MKFFMMAVLVVLALAPAGCGGRQDGEEVAGRVTVVASIAPLANFVSAVGGERVEVRQLVPPGTNPHTFEPTAVDLRALGEAQLLVLNGIGLEFWLRDLVAAADRPELRTVVTAEGLEVIDQGHHHHHGEGGNPHVWLDPVLAIQQVERIWEALSEVDPERAEEYQRRAESYIEELRRLDSDIEEALAGVRHRQFISQHAAWSYFARRYKLVEAGVIETAPGREPSPREIAAIVRTVRESGVPVVFAEPQFSRKAAEAIGEETGARVFLLDPLGAAGVDYIEMMRGNLAKLVEGLGEWEGSK